MSSKSFSTPTIEEAKPTPKYEFKGHESYVRDFVFLHDNSHIHVVSGSQNGTMRKWDCDTGLLVRESLTGKGGEINVLALSPDGKTIACGRRNGSIRRWRSDGEMIKGIWTGHSEEVRALSWSPSGHHIASGSEDGTILIRMVESGKMKRTIKTEQGWVYALAYSPSGDKIASGGWNTICIWDTETGKLVVGPIRGMRTTVLSLVWSLDSTKLYTASNKFALVFDSNSGTELHRFEHDHPLYSVALSPKYNLLACVGRDGIAQLWDTESHQPLGQPFGREDREDIYRVSFSRDGRYLAYSGLECKLTLWVVKDIAPELHSPPPSCLEVDATRWGTDSYSAFFPTYEPYYTSALSGPSRHSQRANPSLARRFWDILSTPRRHPAASESIALQQRPKRRLFGRRTGPQPVAVAAGRKTKRRATVLPPRKINAQTGQLSSTVAQPEAQPNSTPQPQPQVQVVTQQPAQVEDYGCWGNFCLALWCIPRRPRAVSTVQPAPS